MYDELHWVFQSLRQWDGFMPMKTVSRSLCLLLCCYSLNAAAFKMEFEDSATDNVSSTLAQNTQPNDLTAVVQITSESAPLINTDIGDPNMVMQSTRLAVNQAGYLPDAPKHALLVSPVNDETVQLVLANTDMVLTDVKKAPEQLTKEGVKIQWLDFSDIKLAGDYYLRQGGTKSPTFRISADSYALPTWLLLRSYYLQRCGTPLSDRITHLEHAACHLETAYYARADEVNRPEQRHDVGGGWHDAGDFGRYMATATVTVNRLMSLYLMQPNRYQDGDLRIPESGNGQPDLLDEVAIELEWMLKMQRMDGAVYRKVSGMHWVSERRPEEDTNQQLIYGISSPETAKFAASMALAARVYRNIRPESAQVYLTVAENAWSWLQKHPHMTVDWQASDDSGSGKYLLSDTDTETSLEFDDDDRLAAALELFLTTDKTDYRDYVQQHAADAPYTLYEWKDASPLSLWHLLTFDKTDSLSSLRAVIKSRLIARADTILQRIATCPLRMANQRLVWGSNKMLAEEGITLLHAWHLTNDTKYYHAALEQIDFLFGRNPFAMSFITGVGNQAVRTPVHLFGSAIKQTLPGLMVGGPNVLAQDKIAQPEQGVLSYIDNPRAYSVNEYAIDYNASVIGLLEILAIYQQPAPGNTAPAQVAQVH